jgi:hypothetical protein
VWPASTGEMACSHSRACLGLGCAETGCHRGARGGDNGGRNWVQHGGERREPRAGGRGEGLLYEEGAGWGSRMGRRGTAEATEVTLAWRVVSGSG